MRNAETNLEKRIEKTNASKPKNEWKTTTKKSNLSYNEQKEYNKLEKIIATLESKKEGLEGKFSTEDWDTEEINNQSTILQQIIKDIEAKTERWFILSAKHEGE